MIKKILAVLQGSFCFLLYLIKTKNSPQPATIRTNKSALNKVCFEV